MYLFLLLLLPLGFLLGWASGFRRSLRKTTQLYLETLQILAQMLKGKDYGSARQFLAEILSEYQGRPQPQPPPEKEPSP